MRDPNEYIDDIVKEGEGSSFQYKNAYWEEMASLLDANDIRKKRKALLLWTSSVASLLILVIASWAILGTNILYQERPDNKIASFSENNISNYMQQYEVIAANADAALNSMQYPSSRANSVQQSNTIPNDVLAQKTAEGNNNVHERSDETMLNDIALDHLNKLDVMTPQLVDNEKQNDLIKSSEKFEFPTVAEENFGSKHHMSIDGGVGIAGLTGVGGTQLSYRAGLTYSYDLNENWSIQTGLSYLSQGTSLQKTENYSKYSFKRTDEQVHLNYDRLHYAQLPVGVSFKHKRSLFSFELTPSYIVAVESSYQHTRYDHDTKSFNTLEESKSNYGIDEGIQKFDLQIGLSYEYALTSFMNIGASANIGTFDITDNKYWGAESKNINYNASAFLKFNLF